VNYRELPFLEHLPHRHSDRLAAADERLAELFKQVDHRPLAAGRRPRNELHPQRRFSDSARPGDHRDGAALQTAMSERVELRHAEGDLFGFEFDGEFIRQQSRENGHAGLAKPEGVAPGPEIGAAELCHCKPPAGVVKGQVDHGVGNELEVLVGSFVRLRREQHGCFELAEKA
jgi:hypothetical protein